MNILLLLALFGVAGYALIWSQSVQATADTGFQPTDPGYSPQSNEVPLAQIINANSGQFSPADIAAIIAVESNFNAAVLGDNGQAYGLMQIHEAAARQVGYTGPMTGLLDPATNIRVGVLYLGWVKDYLRSKFKHEPTWEQILSGYNAGVGNVVNGYISTAYIGRWYAARSAIV